MLPIDQASAHILARARPPVDTETLGLRHCLGHILAVDLKAPRNVPPMDNSAMDGYAVNTAHLNPNHEYTDLPLAQVIAAGSEPEPLKHHTAARIYTGATLPQGANAVAAQEDCHTRDTQVWIPSNLTNGLNIRCRGEDLTTGQTLLRRGHRLRPPDLGLLAASGIDQVSLFKPLTIAILSTGSELCLPGTPLAAGKIYDANSPMLKSVITELGFHCLDLGIVADSQSATEAALAQACSSADVVIASGGVSVGDADHLKAATAAMGHIDLWRVAMKPGKPFAFGQINATPLFGLPGNPVSCWVTFLLLVKPFLLAQQGQIYRPYRPQTAVADFTEAQHPQRQQYLRINMVEGRAQRFANQSSGALSSVVYADGLAVLPIGHGCRPGDSIEVLLFSELMAP